MSASVIKKKRLIRFFLYLGGGLFCGLFSYVYSFFSHGVSSDFMTFLFVLPLFGALTEGLLFLFRIRTFSRFADNCFHAGIGAGTLGSLLQGIFEIAGTGSAYMIVFPVLFGVFLLAAAAFFVVALCRKEIES